MATRWWSASKSAWQVVEDMHTANLVNAYKKFLRGEYLRPHDPDDPLVVGKPSDLEASHLKTTFLTEFTRRGLDSDGNMPAPPMDEGFA